MPQAEPSKLVLGDIVIDFAGRRLWRGASEQPLEPKAFAVLALLANSPGRVFTRDEILDSVWGHRHVTQSVLNRIMSLLRQALGEDAQHPNRLHTVYGIGYRFDIPEPASEPGPQPEANLCTLATDIAPSVSAEPLPTFVPGRAWNHWRWFTAAGLVAILLSAVSGWLSQREPTMAPTLTTTLSAQPSLAILPFADLSRTNDQAYLADGLAEEIRNQLAQAPTLRVVGRTSSGAFKNKREDLRNIGQKLGVAYLLEGSVRSEGERLRVTTQLVRAEDGTHLWSKTYTRDLRDILTMQEEVSRDVAQAMSVKLDVAKFNREQGGTTNVEAYDRFLRWRSIGMREQFDFEHDRERLQLAREMVALDPQCVLCWDALANSLNSMAKELGDTQAEQLRDEAQQVRGHIAQIAANSWVAKRDRSNALWRAGKRAEAIALAKEVVDSGPLTKERVWDYAYMIYAMGHLNETVALVEQVRAVEPMALFLSRDLQYDYTAARRYADAEAEYQRGRKLEGSQMDPDYVAFIRQLAGQRPGGSKALRDLHSQLLKHTDFNTPFFRALGTALDDRDAMLALVRKALADPVYGGGPEFSYIWTDVADALGDADLAVAVLRKNLESQQGFKQGAMAQFPYVALWNAPRSGLRAHPDFKRLLVEAGVVDYWRQTGRWGDGCEPLGAEDFQCR